MPTVSVTTLAALLLVVLLYRKWYIRKYETLPLPPGPPRRWFVGNLLDFPTSRPWLKFRDWCNEYGGLIYIDLPFKPVIVVGSVKVANDLLVGRSNIYSDRPYSTMLDVLGWSWAFSAMPYNSTWRTHRRLFHDHFNRSVIQEYQPIQLEETHSVLMRMLHSPHLAREHIRSLPGSTIMRIVYGARSASEMREYVNLAESAMVAARQLLIPGAFLAELFPFLRHIPSWMPGGATRRFAEKFRATVQRLRNQPFNEVKQAMAEGKAIPSVAYRLITELQDDEGKMTKEAEDAVRDVSGTAYGAASDTTTAAAEAFVLAMAMHPDVQRKAQEELDRVVGLSRLPDFGDLESLVYLRAVFMETLRWMPTIPTGVPHALSEDDVYEGYWVPKDSLIINAWAMLHDPEDYPDPYTFKPERFLDQDGNIDPSVLDPTTILFGFGRRICAGLDFAETTLNIFMASMLHVYEMKPGVDEDGDPVVLSGEGSDEAICFPTVFPRHIKPRSAQAERLIRDIALPEEFNDVTI
ncbi:cytochrome P450 [Cristinia sonorae]|uniref:Cytochrome P450 n=1 Tax=Cristinia sonorae TaxID=1940300 RepID=A0A8K0XTU5_9AGAR|nr:cytochrome P450 [Cristinia sonorae]